MPETYLKRAPRYPAGAKWLKNNFGKFRDAWQAAEQLGELRKRLTSFLTVPVPKADAVEAFRKLRDDAYEGIT